MIDDFLPQRPANKKRPIVRSELHHKLPPLAEPIPEVILDDDSASEVIEKTQTPDIKNDNPAKPKGSIWKRLRHWRPTKKQFIIIGVAAIVVLGGGGFGLDKMLTHAKPHKITATINVTPVKPTPKPTTVASTLTGLPVAPSINKLPVTAVMIENSTDARPQSGLAQAGMVFEAVAEGGITRYMALYQDTSPGYVGPIRSARPYFIQWELGFDAGYAHVGGSPEAISDIHSWGVKDLDQFYNGNSYQRITTRVAPHNVYTSIATLNTLEASKGYTTSSYTGFTRKSDSPAKTPTATSITLNPSGPDFVDNYSYNSTNNTYSRSVGGAPEEDVDQAGNETQVAPKVIIALVMQQGLEADGIHTTYANIGSGQAYVFQDGTVTIGTWQKVSNTAQITFTDSKGQTIALNDGQTWLTVVGSSGYISYHS